MTKTTSIISAIPKPTYLIKELHITIKINNNMKTAIYKYEYQIIRLDGFNSIWTNTFAYQLHEVKILNVKIDENTGPYWNLDEMETPSKNARLTIDLKDSCFFAYEVETKIEATTNIDFFGGNGCIAFWITHGGECKKLVLDIIYPDGIKIIHIHPWPDENEKYPKYIKNNILPKEFFMVFFTYEKSFLGIPNKAVKLVSRILWLILGACIGRLISYIF